MNTTHVEHDALAALRSELTMAAGRRIRRRRARRRTVVIAALVALLLAATAATAALVKSTTGVPAVDELLEIEVPPGHRPAPGSASKTLKVPEGDHNTNVVAYLGGTARYASRLPTSGGAGAALAEASAAARRWRTSTGGSSEGAPLGSAPRTASISAPTS